MLRAATALSVGDSWSFSGVMGCALLSAIAFGAFLAHQFYREFYLGSLLGILLTCLILIRFRNVPLTNGSPPRWILYIFLFWLVLVSSQYMTPVYTGAFMYGDWWMHFDIAQFYMGLRPLDIQYFGTYAIPSRTPFYSLFAGFFLKLFENQFAVYQVVSVLPGITLLGVLSKFISSRNMILCLCLFFFNPFLGIMILYPWPKVLAAAYVLASLYFYLQWQSETLPQTRRFFLLMWAFWLGFAILTHSGTIVYGIGFVLDSVFRQHNRSSLLQLPIAGLVTTCVVVPWVLWAGSTYGFFALWDASPAALTNDGLFSQGWWVERGLNALGTLLPLPLSLALQSYQGDLWSLWHVWLRFFYAVLPGACTITGSCILLLQLRRNLGIIQTLPWRTLGVLVITGFVGSVILQPGQTIFGLAGENMATIVLLVLIVVVQIAGTFTPRQQRIVMLLTFVEFLASRGLQILFDGLGLVAADDANLLLKQHHHVLFARDMVGMAWLGFVAIVVAIYIFFLWRFTRAPDVA